MVSFLKPMIFGFNKFTGIIVWLVLGRVLEASFCHHVVNRLSAVIFASPQTQWFSWL